MNGFYLPFAKTVCNGRIRLVQAHDLATRLRTRCEDADNCRYLYGQETKDDLRASVPNSKFVSPGRQLRTNFEFDQDTRKF